MKWVKWCGSGSEEKSKWEDDKAKEATGVGGNTLAGEEREKEETRAEWGGAPFKEGGVREKREG